MEEFWEFWAPLGWRDWQHSELWEERELRELLEKWECPPRKRSRYTAHCGWCWHCQGLERPQEQEPQDEGPQAEQEPQERPQENEEAQQKEPGVHCGLQ